MVPYCQLGELLTVDREEIEDLRAVIKLIRRYLQSREGPSDASQIPPCSIVILGPPGTGKTFSVKEIAKSLQHDVGEHKPLTFNLSQFNSVDDLTDAFLRVQERRLCGAVPFVLWDEFDTEQNGRELGWLRQFLVPMEEGRFKRGDTWHPVGQSIFVFAGSSSETFSELQERADNTPNAKATDFLSRVDGYLDLKGVTTEKGEVTPDRVLARAIILNSLLRRTKVSGLATS
ncbi:AAA family ATPase [Frankia sp. EI5c]|uniref:AAA family ATPase n=1 Tax=Frankia sp. EI5c TaxID=683316 RepID=UPI0037C046AC